MVIAGDVSFSTTRLLAKRNKRYHGLRKRACHIAIRLKGMPPVPNRPRSVIVSFGRIGTILGRRVISYYSRAFLYGARSTIRYSVTTALHGRNLHMCRLPRHSASRLLTGRFCRGVTTHKLPIATIDIDRATRSYTACHTWAVSYHSAGEKNADLLFCVCARILLLQQPRGSLGLLSSPLGYNVVEERPRIGVITLGDTSNVFDTYVTVPLGVRSYAVQVMAFVCHDNTVSHLHPNHNGTSLFQLTLIKAVHVGQAAGLGPQPLPPATVPTVAVPYGSRHSDL